MIFQKKWENNNNYVVVQSATISTNSTNRNNVMYDNSGISWICVFAPLFFKFYV